MSFFCVNCIFKFLEDATSVSGKSVAEHYKTTANPVQQKRRHQRLVLGCQMTGVVYKFLAFSTAIADGLKLRFERSQHHWSVQYSWASNKRKALKAEHWLLVSSSLASKFGSCTYSTLVAGNCPMIGRLCMAKVLSNVSLAQKVSQKFGDDQLAENTTKNALTCFGLDGSSAL